MPSVLVLGLSPKHSKSLQFMPEDRLAQMLQASEKALEEAGYDAKCVYLERDDDVEYAKATIKEKDWDTIVIGAGIRTIPELTLVWETLLNAAHLALPNKLLCFNSNPADVLDAVRRVC
ncbi:MAG: hypothetical protein M1820_000198 [Bogoriella megaspora]|nr:MAG: hypothetical protein M1820_000198 [Bogoriella megaspora]